MTTAEELLRVPDARTRQDLARQATELEWTAVDARTAVELAAVPSGPRSGPPAQADANQCDERPYYPPRKTVLIQTERDLRTFPDRARSSSPYLHDADGWLYRLELVDCGKGWSGRCRKCANGPGHGPYWYRYRWEDGKMHKRYVGKRLALSALGSIRQSRSRADAELGDQLHT